MRKLPLIVFIALCSIITNAQNGSKSKSNASNVVTEIKPEYNFDVSIIQVYPDSFPKVSVVFQAKNYLGEPLWLLDRQDLAVQENGESCEVIRVQNISANRPLNIGLVFDHSGSMIENPSHMPFWISSAHDILSGNSGLTGGYKMALDYAKEGVLEFLSETEHSNDSVLFVGFSGTVDKIYPLTNEFDGISAFVRNVLPAGSTAFYDALYTAVDSLKDHSSQPVIVALTDGRDNVSNHTFNDVINHANQCQVSIYIIGLGDVYEPPLKLISEQTNGFYYYTESANALVGIYHNVRKQLKSIYQLDYESINVDRVNEEMETRFAFNNDTMMFSNHSAIVLLPTEVVAYLQEMQQERIQRLITYGGIGMLGIALVGIGGFFVHKKNKPKHSLEIKSAFPNPFVHELMVQFSIPEGAIRPELVLRNGNGKVVISTPILLGANQSKIETSKLRNGIYFLQIISGNNVSEIIKVVKQ